MAPNDQPPSASAATRSTTTRTEMRREANRSIRRPIDPRTEAMQQSNHGVPYGVNEWFTAQPEDWRRLAPAPEAGAGRSRREAASRQEPCPGGPRRQIGRAHV